MSNACRCQIPRQQTKTMSDWSLGGWTAVKGELPKPFVVVVTKIEDSFGDREIQRGQYAAGIWLDDKGKVMEETPTHWKPIP